MIGLRLLLHIREDHFFQEVSSAPLLLGRSDQCDVIFPIQGVSRRHAQLFLFENRWAVRDLGSTHGTRVNGEFVDQDGTFVGDRDLVQIGPSQIQVSFTVQSDLRIAPPAGYKPYVPALVSDRVIKQPLDDSAMTLDEPVPSLPRKRSADSTLQGTEDELDEPVPQVRATGPAEGFSAAATLNVASVLESTRLGLDGSPLQTNPQAQPDNPPPPRLESPCRLASDEELHVTTEVAGHVFAVTNCRAVWKGAGEFQSLFWSDVLAVSATPGSLTFRLVASPVTVELPVGEGNEELLDVVQKAREAFDARRAAKLLTAD